MLGRLLFVNSQTDSVKILDKCPPFLRILQKHPFSARFEIVFLSESG